METLAVRYDRWKAPSEDGRMLIWPPPARLLDETRDNHRRLAAADSVLVQNVPLSEVRRRMRGWIGHADEQLLIATGHQTELHHPGVWAKNVLIDAASRTLDGRAFHFAVDTDEPKHLAFRWPGGSVPLSDDPAVTRAEWAGLVPAPMPAHLNEVERALASAAAGWNFEPLVFEFVRSMRRLSLEKPNLPSALTESLHQIDWALGLRHDAMIVSPICLSEPYLLFVHHVLSRADRFGADYNAALGEFRRENRIKTPGRPMPDLKQSADSCEVPFWLDSLTTGARSRAAVVRSGERWALRSPASDDQFVFDPAADGWDSAGALLLWLRRNGLRLSPRALTLTAVLRLLVADQFVHGIGGGHYDQVLDRLIARHFALEPPRFSVSTATLYFPEAVGQTRVCLPCLAGEGHRLKNAVLGEKKMQMVREIAALPRRSRERSRLFYRMHDELTSARNSPRVKAWEQSFRDAERRAQEERVLFDRELFYAIQPADRLAGLIDRYRRQFE